MELAAIASRIQGHLHQWKRSHFHQQNLYPWGLRIVTVPMMTGGLLVGMTWAYSPLGVAPEIDLISSSPQLKASLPSAPASLETLYALRDRPFALQPTIPSTTRFAFLGNHLLGNDRDTPFSKHPSLHALHARIHIEETAHYHWANAQKLARRARHIERQRPLTLSRIEESDTVWSAALQQLEAIPPESFVIQNVTDAIADYQNRRTQLAYRYDTKRSDFLRAIVESAGLDVDAAHITVCNLESESENMPFGECRRLNGDRPPASAASLIKVPIAVALMQKIADTPIDLSTELYIAPHNFTEDASDIGVGTRYSLRRVVARMINQSSNIAANQLIDYLGTDYINAVLGDRGYEDIRVGHKLVGDRIVPTQFGKRVTNRITTDDLTAIMADIYLQRRPGDAVLRGMLATQTDERMGQTALQGKDIEWLGEKTGWNSTVLGTTSAAVIGGDRYILTIALNDITDPTVMQYILRTIASHILEHNGLPSHTSKHPPIHPPIHSSTSSSLRPRHFLKVKQRLFI